MWGWALENILKILFTAHKRVIRSIEWATQREHTNLFFLKHSIVKWDEILSYVMSIETFRAKRTSKFNSSYYVNTKYK